MKRKNRLPPVYSSGTFIETHVRQDQDMRTLMDHQSIGFFMMRVEDMLRLTRLPVPPSRSSGHTMVFLTAGKARMRIGDTPVQIKTPEVMVVAAGKVFSYDYFETNKGYVLHFTDTFLTKQVLARNLYAGFDFLQVWGAPVIRLKRPAAKAVWATMERMLAVCTGKGAFTPGLLQAYLLSVLMECKEAEVWDKPTKTIKAVGITRRFQELLFRHFNSQHRVTYYADAIGISANHLNKTVQAVTGKSPTRHIDEAILLEAKVLLHQTSMAMAEISKQLGLEDQSYFSRFFKKYEGVSPTNFRNGLKNPII